MEKTVNVGIKSIIPWRKIGLEALERLERKSPSLYNPPPKPQRAFEQDYPNGARHDATGRLTPDIDGNPIDPGARLIGRQVVGGSDVPLSVEEYDALTKETLGLGLARAPQRKLPDKAVGAYFKEKLGNELKKIIAPLSTLPEEDTTIVILSRPNRKPGAPPKTCALRGEGEGGGEKAWDKNGKPSLTRLKTRDFPLPTPLPRAHRAGEGPVAPAACPARCV